MDHHEHHAPIKTHVPHDRLTNLCDEMTKPLEREENADIKGIVLLDDGEHGGVVLHGYDDERQAMTDLVVHLQALGETVGVKVNFLGIPDSPAGL